MAIAKVDGVGGGDDPLNRRGVGSNDEVVLTKLEGTGRRRVERKQSAIDAVRKGDVIENGAMNPLLRNRPGDMLLVGEQAINIRLRKQGREGFDDLFAAALREEPVMNDCHLHICVPFFVALSTNAVNASTKVAESNFLACS